MIVVATDAPLDARDLERLAARAIFALARTGSTYSQRQRRLRDRVLDASVAARDGRRTPQPRTVLPTDGVSPLFEAVLDATEEAVDNSLLKATDTTGNGRTIRAIPIRSAQDVAREVRPPLTCRPVAGPVTRRRRRVPVLVMARRSARGKSSQTFLAFPLRVPDTEVHQEQSACRNEQRDTQDQRQHERAVLVDEVAEYQKDDGEDNQADRNRRRRLKARGCSSRLSAREALTIVISGGFALPSES